MKRLRDRLHLSSRKKKLEQHAQVHSNPPTTPIPNAYVGSSDDLRPATSRPPATPSQVTETVDPVQPLWKSDLLNLEADGHVSSSDDLPPTTSSPLVPPSKVTETVNPVQSLWTLAYTKLKGQDPELIREFRRCLGLTATDDGHINDTELDDITKRALRELGKSEEVRGDKLSRTKASIRKYFEQTVKVVSASNGLISAAISSNPYAALAWTGVSLLLPLILSPTEENEAAIQGLECVASLIVVYRWYEKSYLREGETSDFKNLTIRLYTLLLEYEATLLVHKHRNAPKRWAKDVFAAGDWSSQISKIKEADAQCRAVIHAISDARAKEWRDEERKWQAQLLRQPREDEERRNIRKLYLNYEAGKNANPERIPGTCEWFLNHPGFLTWRESQKSSILWLSADPGCGKSVLSKHLVDRRGEVMTMNTDASLLCYFFYKDGDLDRMDAAKGLCAMLHQLFMQDHRLYQHAKVDFETKNEKFLTDLDTLWNVFLRAAEDSSNREIICVLDALDECQEQSRKALIAKLTHLYHPHRSAANGSTIMKFLVTSRPDFGIVRDFKDVTSALSEIRLRGEEESEQISQEIDLVIRRKTKDLALKMDLHKRDKKQLLQNLSSIPHRTYLWLHLTFDVIEEKLEFTKTDIRVIAETVFKSVDEAYTNILEKSPDRERARKLLHIILVAKRSLTFQEINVAMVIDESHRSYQDIDFWESNVAQDRIKNICGLFVSVVNSEVYLIHQIAREFLLSEKPGNQSTPFEGWKKSFQLAQSNLLLAQISIQYLGLDDFDADDSSKDSYRSRQALARSAESGSFYEDDQSSTEDEHFESDDNEHSEKRSLTSERSVESQVLSKENVLRLETSETAGIGAKDESEDGAEWEWETLSNDNSEDDKDASQGQIEVLIARVDVSIDYPLIGKFKNYYHFLSYASQFWAAHLSQAGSLSQPALIESVAFKMYKTSSEAFRLWYSIYHAERESVYKEYYTSPGLNIIPASHFGHLEVVRLLHEREGIQHDAVDGHHRTPLMLAAEAGHEEIVNRLLNWGASIEWKDDRHHTALHCAAAEGHTTIIKMFLDSGALIDTMDDDGDTPLHLAIRYGKVVVVHLLLANGANTILRNHNDMTSLCMAARYGHTSIVKLLLGKGVQVDSRDISDHKPLFFAAEEGHNVVVRMLLEKGACADFCNEHGRTPISSAANKGQINIVHMLLERGARVDSQDKIGRTPLFEATFRGHESIVELLLDRGARVDSKDKSGRTPLFEAAFRGHEGIIELLLDREARVDSRDKSGWTLLLEASREGYEGIVELLLNRGARVDSEDKNGQTLLLEASCEGYEDIVKLLLNRGARVDSKDKIGRTPLFKAAYVNKVEIVDLLLNHEAQIDLCDNQDQSPLWVASSRDCSDVVKLLLKRGAEVDSRNRIGQTPLWIASGSSRGNQSVKLLLDHGAQVDSIDNIKRTPLWIASVHGSVETSKLLLEGGAQVDSRDKKCRTPLWIAAKCCIDPGRGLDYGKIFDYERVIELLLDQQAQVDSRDKNGRTPLWIAVKRGVDFERSLTHEKEFLAYEGIIQLLLNGGAQVDSRDRKGRTPLWVAVKGRRKRIVKLLLEREARTNQVWRVLSSPKKLQQLVTKPTLERRARKHLAWRVLAFNKGQKRVRGRKRVVRMLGQRIQCLREFDYRSYYQDWLMA
ncbi:hypothetical protein G7Y79_00002g007680 [Physcia stellaris]|nr:hypothetical protein G7Y79_00002g007680 [Physcia stellaris]